MISNERDANCSITIVLLDVHWIYYCISSDTTGFGVAQGKILGKQRVLPPNSFWGSYSPLILLALLRALANCNEETICILFAKKNNGFDRRHCDSAKVCEQTKRRF